MSNKKLPKELFYGDQEDIMEDFDTEISMICYLLKYLYNTADCYKLLAFEIHSYIFLIKPLFTTFVESELPISKLFDILQNLNFPNNHVTLESYRSYVLGKYYDYLDKKNQLKLEKDEEDRLQRIAMEDNISRKWNKFNDGNVIKTIEDNISQN